MTADSDTVTADSDTSLKSVTIKSVQPVTAPESTVTPFSEAAVTMRRNPHTRITSLHYAHLCGNTLNAAVTKLPSFGHQPENKVQAIR